MGNRKIQRSRWDTIQDAKVQALRPYVVAAGQASAQWNMLHEALGLLFVTLMGGGYMNQFSGIWGAVTSDRTKRDMVLAALRGRQDMIGPQIAKRDEDRAKLIELLCKQATSLEDERNNVVHAPLLQIGFGQPIPTRQIVPDSLMSNKRAQRLEGRNLLADFRYCRDYAKILGQFALDLEMTYRAPGLPLPAKPRPPRRDGNKTATARRPHSRARPQPQPRSSKE